MKFVSTRGGRTASFDEALVKGIAGDGGLFVPALWPAFRLDDFAAASSIQGVARVFLSPFFDGSKLEADLPEIVAETFSFPIPAAELPVSPGRACLLELFHGPTAAFKDVGAAFLASCLSRLEGDTDRPLTILVATSGDTGGAVAAAFDRRPGMRVVVLFPQGRVSARQEKQLTCWSDNVLSLSVNGSFDDCQSLVKAAMADRTLNQQHRFSSANSINIGRLLPQCCYYADASLRHFRDTCRKPSFIVPTGNLGNGLACILAREAGLPVGRIILACNANRLIADYLGGAEWLPRASVRTLASAMDVGFPSNMERLINLHGEADILKTLVSVTNVDDDAIREQIRKDFRRFGFAVCPHTATATYAYDQLADSERTDDDWILAATAHPAKFDDIVEPLIGTEIPVPGPLASILSRPSSVSSISPDLKSLSAALTNRFAA
ncbi:MAG: threonine synthase [Gammaproteobacteria bacterium]|nr:threonine synthase [Gammaproteobacteria bacterium]MDH4313937.1 threonine synthase [Gammaproteobacteria bacterium]MDH5212987.1 threonine synthase [Gammaproteobacteria bacterium]MDH5502346.1 threonine synthase [Gammaproteobacteria bacterium]